LLFRLFDIVKIGPVGWADKKLPGEWGVMMDDIIAGIFAAFCVWVLREYGLQY
jgi:phosphatidylglycerophosphatase A